MINVGLIKKTPLIFSFVITMSLLQVSALALFHDKSIPGQPLGSAPTEASGLGETVYGILGVPPDHVKTVPDVIYRVILPFVGLMAIVFGIMSEVRLFGGHGNKLRFIIAFVMVFSTMPLGWFYLMVNVIFQAGTVFAFLIFIALFFMGIFLVGISHTSRNVSEIRDAWRNFGKGVEKYDEEIGRLEAEDEKLEKREYAAAKAGNKEAVRTIREARVKIKEKLKIALKKRGNMIQAEEEL